MSVLCMKSTSGFQRGTIYDVTMIMETTGLMSVMNEKGEEKSFPQESPNFEIL